MRRLLLILIMGFFSHFIHAQNREVDYSNPSVTMDDLDAILQSLKMDIYKFGVHLPDSQRYEVCLYLEEYADKEMIKEQTVFCSPSTYRSFKDGKMILKPFDGARFIIKDNKDEFLVNIRMGNFGHPEYKVEIDSMYSNMHTAARFKIEDTTLQVGKTPLFLIGSFWESKLPDGKTLPDGSTSIFRFCVERELSPDCSSDAFNKMPHYYIFGLKVIEIDK